MLSDRKASALLAVMFLAIVTAFYLAGFLLDSLGEEGSPRELLRPAPLSSSPSNWLPSAAARGYE